MDVYRTAGGTPPPPRCANCGDRITAAPVFSGTGHMVCDDACAAADERWEWGPGGKRFFAMMREMNRLLRGDVDEDRKETGMPIEIVGEDGMTNEDRALLAEARAVLGPEAEAWDLRACRIAARCRLAILDGADAKATWGGARYGNVSMGAARLYTDRPYGDEAIQRARWTERVVQLRAVAECKPLPGGIPDAVTRAGE